MEKNLKEQVRAEIQHHISPLIGWLRQDAAKGRVDDNGDRLDQWHARSELVVESIVKLVGEVEYEYAVVSDRWLEAGWSPDDEDDWTTMGEATDQLIHFDTWFPKHTHRIVKRRKAGKVEEI